jgi:hypothetical protein
MCASSAISFFNVKPSSAERKARARAAAKATITKREKAAILAYQRANPAERKRLLRDQVDLAQQVRLDALRAQRRDYMRTWRMLRRLGTVLL